jgi:hypothetical protein
MCGRSDAPKAPQLKQPTFSAPNFEARPYQDPGFNVPQYQSPGDVAPYMDPKFNVDRVERAPDPREMSEFFNMITGTKFSRSQMRGTDGRPTSRTSVERIRNQAEQAFISGLEEAMRETMQGIQQLSKTRPDVVQRFMPFINTIGNLNQETVADVNRIAGFQGFQEDVNRFRAMSRAYVEENFDRQARALEDSLAQRGLSHSPEGSAARRNLEQSFNKSIRDNDFESIQKSRDFAAQEFKDQKSRFDVRQTGRDRLAQGAEAEYNLMRQYDADLEADRTLRFQEQGSLLNTQNALLKDDFNRGMSGNVEGHALGLYGTDNQIQNQAYANKVHQFGADLNHNQGQLDASGRAFTAGLQANQQTQNNNQHRFANALALQAARAGHNTNTFNNGMNYQLGRQQNHQSQLAHYDAGNATTYRNYDMAMQQHNADNQPGFFQQAVGLAGTLGAAYLGGPAMLSTGGLTGAGLGGLMSTMTGGQPNNRRNINQLG